MHLKMLRSRHWIRTRSYQRMQAARREVHGRAALVGGGSECARCAEKVFGLVGSKASAESWRDRRRAVALNWAGAVSCLCLRLPLRLLIAILLTAGRLLSSLMPCLARSLPPRSRFEVQLPSPRSFVRMDP